MQMNKGDILGHEFCGVVEKVGPAVRNIQVGKRYVVSFQIACGDVRLTLSLDSGCSNADGYSASTASKTCRRSAR